MTYEYESNGACPFCGLRGCDHDRTRYQGPFGIAPKVSAAAPPHAALLGEVARPSADETGALILAGADAAPIELDVCDRQVSRTGGPGQADIQQPTISAYDEPVAPPPTVVPITPKVGVERVLQVIEKRSKRKKPEQGSLF